MKYSELPLINRLGHVLFFVTILTVAIVVIISVIISPDATEIKQPVVVNNELNGSVWQVRSFLRTNLNDWSSYEPIEWSRVYRDTTRGEYWVRHKYRAANSFGAKIIQNQIFYMDTIEGTVLRYNDN